MKLEPDAKQKKQAKLNHQIEEGRAKRCDRHYQPWKIDFAENWVHLRKSNTEPIIRIYTEAKTQAEADALALRIIDEIKEIAGI